MIYRRFGFLHARVLLQKQDELREMEKQLEAMDDNDSKGPEVNRLSLRSRVRDDTMKPTEPGKPTRKELLGKVEAKLLEYGNSAPCKIVDIH